MATFSVDGFSWEANLPRANKVLHTREEAEAALDRLGPPATNTKHYREAMAAWSVCDYTHVVRCCDAADEVGSAERWS
jgi:hypothetical protein